MYAIRSYYVLILASVITLGGLGIWRVHLLSHLLTDPWEKYAKAFSRAPVFLFILTAGFLVLWLWNVYDTFELSQGKSYNFV